MEGFTLVDGIVAGVIVISAILAYARGFVREALSIGGWILAAVVAFILRAETRLPLIREIPLTWAISSAKSLRVGHQWPASRACSPWRWW